MRSAVHHTELAQLPCSCSEQLERLVDGVVFRRRLDPACKRHGRPRLRTALRMVPRKKP